jgi:hypothetical protein
VTTEQTACDWRLIAFGHQDDDVEWTREMVARQGATMAVMDAMKRRMTEESCEE